MAHTLLLADDSVTIQRVIELTFADEDVEVVAVSDGDQAIERLESAPPDIVLADIGMPGKDGYEVARYVKQSPKLSHIPVVLLTGAFEPVDQARAEEVGCDGVLAKPFEPQLVIGRVKELLAQPAKAAQPAKPLDVNVRPAAPAAPVVRGDDLDDYFDDLDAAFANLSSKGTVVPPPRESPPPRPPIPPPQEVHPDEIARFASEAAPGTFVPDVPVAPKPPLTPPAPPPVPAPPIPAAAPPSASAEAKRPAAAAPPPSTLSPALAAVGVADVFAALLAAEANQPLPELRPAWPSASGGAGGSGALMSVPDDLVDQVTRRVLAQMSDQAVRATVSDIVSQVAERLVREEIEKIKASIK